MTIEIKSVETIILLCAMIFLFYNTYTVAMNNPIAFGDEGFHSRMAELIAEDKEYFVWIPTGESDVRKNGYSRPPLWNFLEASFLFVFGNFEWFLKFLTPFIAFLTGLEIYLLLKKAFNRRVGFMAAMIAATVPAFVTYSVLFYTDVLVTFFFSMAVFTFILGMKEGGRKYWLLSGVFGGLSFLSKNSGLMFYAFVAFMFVYQLAVVLAKGGNKKPLLKKYLAILLILGFMASTYLARNIHYYGAPCALPFVQELFDTSGCTYDVFESQYDFGQRTTGGGTESEVFAIGITNYIEFAYGNIWFVAFALFAGLALVVSTLKVSMPDYRTVLLIVLLLFIPLFFYYTGRAEDTSRYTLIWVPIIAAVAALYFDEVYKLLKGYWKYLGLIVIIFVMAMSYMNFLSKLTGMNDYVKPFSPSLIEACDWIKKNTPEDSTLSTIWAAATAYNCKRNTVGMNADLRRSYDVNYTVATAREFGIDYFFIQKNTVTDRDDVSEQYSTSFLQFLADNPESFEKVYENSGNILYKIL